MCSGSEAGSIRGGLVVKSYHSTLGVRAIKKKEKCNEFSSRVAGDSDQRVDVSRAREDAFARRFITCICTEQLSTCTTEIDGHAR